jgi:hypothetical protein
LSSKIFEFSKKILTSVKYAVSDYFLNSKVGDADLDIFNDKRNVRQDPGDESELSDSDESQNPDPENEREVRDDNLLEKRTARELSNKPKPKHRAEFRVVKKVKTDQDSVGNITGNPENEIFHVQEPEMISEPRRTASGAKPKDEKVEKPKKEKAPKKPKPGKPPKNPKANKKVDQTVFKKDKFNRNIDPSDLEKNYLAHGTEDITCCVICANRMILRAVNNRSDLELIELLENISDHKLSTIMANWSMDRQTNALELAILTDYRNGFEILLRYLYNHDLRVVLNRGDQPSQA